MDYTQFKQEVLKITTIDLNAYKENQMKRRIDALIRKYQCNGYDSFCTLIKKDKEVLERFINYLTINVSEFFRNPSQWNTLEKEVIPLLLSKKRNIKIWSAACSTGDEPYSLAMLLSKFMPLSQVKIIATDIDKEILEKAKKGQYIEKSLANLPLDFKQKYFTQAGGIYTIKQEIKNCISFEKHDLLRDAYPKQVDLIVCRNVLIYFTEDAKDKIYKRFSEALAPEGILFVGSTEQIITPQNYRLAPYRIFFYQKA